MDGVGLYVDEGVNVRVPKIFGELEKRSG